MHNSPTFPGPKGTPDSGSIILASVFEGRTPQEPNFLSCIGIAVMHGASLIPRPEIS